MGFAIEFSRGTKNFVSAWRQSPRCALNRLSLQIKPGEVVGFMGPNGSGKSTALKIAAGLLAPTVGSCLVLGKTATRPLARALIGYMPESPSFPDHLTGEEVVRYYAELSGLKSPTARMAARQALAQAGLQGAKSRPAEAHAWLCQVHRALPANNPAAQSGRVLRKIRDLEAQLQLPAVQTYKPTAGESDTNDTGIADLPDGL